MNALLAGDVSVRATSFCLQRHNLIKVSGHNELNYQLLVCALAFCPIKQVGLVI